MGAIKYGSAIVVLVFCLFITVGGGSAIAQPEDLGEVCLETQGEMGFGLSSRLHVIRYGVNTFQLIGEKLTGGDNVRPVHGAAVVDGKNVLIMTLSSSDSGIYSITSNYVIELKSPMSNGVVTTIETTEMDSFSGGEPIRITTTSRGSFRFTQCP